MTEKVKRFHFGWNAFRGFRWVPNWERTWYDKPTDYRFRVIFWGWWVLTVRFNRPERRA